MIIFDSTDPTVNPLNDFLKNYGIWIAIALAGAVFIAVLIMFIIALYKRKHEGPKKEQKATLSDRAIGILNALKGKDNIISHSFVGSRMSLELKDYDVDSSKLKELGVDTIIKMSNKIILVMKDDLSKIYLEMFND